jgi:hypothetical protein
MERMVRSLVLKFRVSSNEYCVVQLLGLSYGIESRYMRFKNFLNVQPDK